MRRREVIAGLVYAGALRALPASAQTVASPRSANRIAIVHPAERLEALTLNGNPSFQAFFRELSRRGYVENRNLVVERYSGRGQIDQYGTLAREVIASRPDVIVSIGVPLALQFKAATKTIPLVVVTADPIAVGLVDSLAGPNGNITGVSADAGLEIYGKRLQLLAEITRKLTNARALVPTYGKWWDDSGPTITEAARHAGVFLAPTFVRGADVAAYEQAFDSMQRDRVDGLIVSDGAEHLTNRALIASLAARHRIPTVYPFREFTEAGGLMSYGINVAVLMGRLAGLTDEVLRGANAGGIPFYQATRFDLVLNKSTARSLGLEFPANLLSLADDVIDP